MSCYKKPRLRMCRRLGELPGLSRKTSSKQYPPGEHSTQARKLSEYGIRLEEKQKLRFNYGISEKQLLKYVQTAKKVSKPTGHVLLQLLEMRLDNTVFRLGMAPTIPAAKQLINHKHILVNNKTVSICSYQCRPGNIIKIRNKLSSIQLAQKYLSYPNLLGIPNHLELDKQKLYGYVKAIVEQKWLSLELNELLVVEYYSKK
uniref:Ribosomal protein S4 n=1 Tax=Hildenbrandia rivularis TaxID=135206 RepID=A0A1C9CFH2_9FLOR|nr:ribosomal protein S4 [Hildenbrandia rivularis]AOM67148.1 ribosomal protein S4 [Hildenbrandia rivularis]